MSDDIVGRLRDRLDGCLCGDTGDDIREAAVIIERLRASYISEALEMGYGAEDAAEMLAQIEAGDGA